MIRVQAVWYILAAILAYHGACSAGVMRSDVDEQLYVELAGEPRFDPVGRFWWRFSFDGGFVDSFASGVLIGERWILTAKHVPGVHIDGTVTQDLGFQVNDGDIVPFTQIIDYPLDDLSLVELASPIPNVPPAKLYRWTDEVGKTGEIAGYGDWHFSNEVGPPRENPNRDIKRAGRNVIDGLFSEFDAPPAPWTQSEDLLFVDFDYPEPNKTHLSYSGSTEPIALEYSVGQGDSGGALLIERNGDHYLAGITSGGDSTFRSPNGRIHSKFVRVSNYVDWIAETLIPASTFAGDYNSDGVIDHEDYGVWRDSYGAAGFPLPADGNGNGVVDAADYTVWRDAVSATSVAVPEPSNLVYSLIASVAWLRLRTASINSSPF